MRAIIYMAKRDPDLLVAGLFGAAVASGIYAAYVAAGLGMSKLIG